jgi:hypothetical protein
VAHFRSSFIIKYLKIRVPLSQFSTVEHLHCTLVRLKNQQDQLNLVSEQARSSVAARDENVLHYTLWKETWLESEEN